MEIWWLFFLLTFVRIFPPLSSTCRMRWQAWIKSIILLSYSEDMCEQYSSASNCTCQYMRVCFFLWRNASLKSNRVNVVSNRTVRSCHSNVCLSFVFRHKFHKSPYQLVFQVSVRDHMHAKAINNPKKWKRNDFCNGHYIPSSTGRHHIVQFIIMHAKWKSTKKKEIFFFHFVVFFSYIFALAHWFLPFIVWQPQRMKRWKISLNASNKKKQAHNNY